MLQDWNDDMDDEDRNESLDILTLTEIIFLPLGFLTGYFGMNFTTMGMVGHNVDKKGILMWKHGHLFIKGLLVLSLISSIGYLYYLDTTVGGENALKREINRLTEIQATAGDS